jgi:hypothetical protein
VSARRRPAPIDLRGWGVAPPPGFDFARRATPKPALAPVAALASSLPWPAWLAQHAPGYVRAGFAPRHESFWDWVWAVQAGERPPPLIAIWPRGGGKSTSAELATAALLVRGVRRYALYVSGSQDQADKHVEAIGTILEALGVERSVNKYGASRGWRRNRLRAAAGFTVDAFGLDTGSRGTKDDDARPDLIIFDDLDEIHDSPATTRKKIETLTMTVLPAATDTAAILGLQNLIHAHSIFAQLADGRAEWLADRVVSGPHPALTDYAAEPTTDDAGRRRYRVSGAPTWAGQSLAACQRLVDTIGPEAFERESQHEVGIGQHLIYAAFDEEAHVCPPFVLPDAWPRYLGLDFGGVHTAAVLLAEEPGTKRLYLYREYLAGDRSAAEHAKALLRGEPMVPFCVGGSKSEGQWRREFAMGGLPVKPPELSEVELGIDRVKGAFARGEIVIFDTCPGLISELRTYRRPRGADGAPQPGIENKATYHRLDALRYIVARIRRTEGQRAEAAAKEPT